MTSSDNNMPGEVEREPYSPIDDEVHRAFIDGWNARLDHTDFDMALHYWMLRSVTHIGPAALTQQESRNAE